MKKIWMCDHVEGNCNDCNPEAAERIFTEKPMDGIFVCTEARPYVLLTEEEYNKLIKGITK